MEYLTYEGENQKKIEKFVLIVYCVYYLNMITKIVRLDWDTWIGLVLTGLLAFCWIINVGRSRTYGFRANFYAISMQVSLIIYSIGLGDITPILPIFIAFIVFFGLFGIENIVRTTLLSSAVLIGYHGLILKSISLSTWNEKLSFLLQIGNILCVIYVVYIWTKRNREGSTQLLEVIKELRSLENSKDDFLANVSHEIRTPINTICGMSEIILKEDLPDKVKENVQDIQMAARNLTSVVRDILDFSELQSGNIEMEEEAYNISSTVNDIINMCIARKEEKKLELIVDCDANIPSVLLGDEKKIRRVIMNLVDNAIKFKEKGGVCISIHYRKEVYGINLIVTVKDTGIGISPESLEKLFRSFNQVDGSRRRQEGGLGLGLSISWAIAQKLGATLSINSSVGKGSVIKFVIPQKVLDWNPITQLKDRQKINVATYIDMEQFELEEIRDEYSKVIVNMVKQLRGNCHMCRNFSELQRRHNKESFSHIFISISEYVKEREYFDSIAEKTKVIVVLNQDDEKKINNERLLKIYKPFYILTIVSVLNNDREWNLERLNKQNEKLTIRDAHVLIVDDNHMNLRVMEGIMSGYGIKTTVATSGKEALEKIQTKEYDFVFMDHMMPEMDGVEAMHRIRSKVGEYYQLVPIVALTANAVAGTREMFIEEGFNDFLEKPVERSVLERVLKRNISAEKFLYEDKNNTDNGDKEGEMIMEQKNYQDNSVEENLSRTLKSYGIDIEKGILYCNGFEAYIEILKEFCETYKESAGSSGEFFETQDWKNYTIVVHGMKSSLRSIGAMDISNSAEKLERAGKTQQIDYILEKHEKFISEYRELFEKLCQIDCLKLEVKTQDEKMNTVEVSNAIPLSSEEFVQKLVDMEDSAYAQMGDELYEQIVELQQYQYQGTLLRELLVPSLKKVEKSDYISAVEMIERIKNKLSAKEG